MSNKIYECWDNDYTYFVLDGKVLLGVYHNDDDADDVARDAYRSTGFEVIEGGDVSEEIKAEYIAQTPNDPEGDGLDNDSDWLEHAIANKRIMLE